MDDTLYDGTGLPPEDGQTPVEVPAGSLDDRIAWVGSGETVEERTTRAEEVWGHEQDAGGTDLDALSASLTAAVYGTAQPGQEDAAPGTSGDEQTPGAAPAEQPETVASAAPQEIPGELVHTDVPPGEAVNAETGEVTAPGEQLPPIIQEGGTPLDPAPQSTPQSTE